MKGESHVASERIHQMPEQTGSSPEKTDRELLEAARTVDGEALDRLLARHEKRVYRFGLRMCGSEEDAREVLQETLLTAFQGLHAFRGDAELSTWLFQLARTHCLRSRRRRAGAPEQVENLDAPGVDLAHDETRTPDEESQVRQLGEILQAAILALPEDKREVLILRDVEGLSAEEAAAVVGIEVRALKSRLHRARLELRGHLASLLHEDDSAGGRGCPELAEELSAFAAQEVDQSTCLRIEAHLDRCPQCAEACESLKRSVSLCRRIPGDTVPAPVRTAVRSALRRAISGTPVPGVPDGQPHS